MFRNNKKEIEFRIMNVIREKISQKQAEYEEGCKQIDTESAEKVKAIYNQQLEDKTVLADKCVNDILGKII